jgi:hypothetical protein
MYTEKLYIKFINSKEILLILSLFLVTVCQLITVVLFMLG